MMNSDRVAIRVASAIKYSVKDEYLNLLLEVVKNDTMGNRYADELPSLDEIMRELLRICDCD